MNPMKKPEIKRIKKIILRFSLALPIIIGLLWIILSAALASDHYDSGLYVPCIPGETPVVEGQIPGQEHDQNRIVDTSRPDLSPKTLYWGQYRTLSFMEKVKIKTAPAVNPRAFDLAAIAFAFSLDQFAPVVANDDCRSVVYNMISEGRLAFALRGDRNIEILPSDDILRVWSAGIHGISLRPLSAGNSQTMDYAAWSSEWQALVPSDSRPSLPNVQGPDTFYQSLQNSLFSISDATTSDTPHLEDVFAISPENNLFGIESQDRLVTWDAAHPFPALTILPP